MVWNRFAMIAFAIILAAGLAYSLVDADGPVKTGTKAISVSAAPDDVRPSLAQPARVPLPSGEGVISLRPTVRAAESPRDRARRIGGWPEFDAAGRYRQRNGLGRPKDAFDLLWRDRKSRAFELHSRRAPEYSLAWYGYYLDVYYFARRAARHDPSFEVRADTLFNIAGSTDEFRTLRELGEPGVRMYRLFLAIR